MLLTRNSSEEEQQSKQAQQKNPSKEGIGGHPIHTHGPL